MLSLEINYCRIINFAGGEKNKKHRNYVSTIPSLDRTRIINTRICIQTQLFKKRSALILYILFFLFREMMRIYRGVEQHQI